MSGRLRLRSAIHDTAKKHADIRSGVRRATVIALEPLTVQPFNFSLPLVVGEDFELGAWMKMYQAIVGLEVDDLVLMAHHEDWVLFDAVTDKTVTFGTRSA